MDLLYKKLVRMFKTMVHTPESVHFFIPLFNSATEC